MSKLLAVTVVGALLLGGCASLGQETAMFHGPFGRTEIGGYVLGADPAAGKILVETLDRDLWIYDVAPRASARLGSLAVGDEVSLGFDDRVDGKRAISVTVLPPGTHRLALGGTVADFLPAGVVLGAPAVAPGTGFVTGTAGTVTASGGNVATVGGGVVAVGPGVIVPGFAPFSALPAGVLMPQTALGLGLVPGATTLTTTTPGAATAAGFPPGRTPVTQGNFTPGTIAPGVTTANPGAPGSAVIQGPFTPGTIAPGVSAPRGNAPPTSPLTGPGSPSGTTTVTPASPSGTLSGSGRSGTGTLQSNPPTAAPSGTTTTAPPPTQPPQPR